MKDLLQVVDLPTDHTRPALKTYASQRVDYVLEEALVSQLKKMASKAGASFFVALLAGFKVLAHRLTASEDIVVGIPTAGQSISGYTCLVGHCVNTLPIRTQPSATISFAEFLKQVRGTMLDALEHQQYTFGSLLRKLPLTRDPSRLPLVSVLFNVDQGLAAEDMHFHGLQAQFDANPRSFENFDLFVNAVELHGRVTLECQYNTDLFKGSTIRRWMQLYKTLLGAILESSETGLGALQWVSSDERQKILRINQTAVDYPRERCIHELFVQRVQSNPDAVAVICGEHHISYGALDQRSDALAGCLRQQGVKPGVFVGLCVERSIEMVVGMLGILKAGGAYVPLDPKFPADRLAFMVGDSQMPIIVTQGALVGSLPPHNALVICLESIDSQTTTVENYHDDAENLAYVIYTSGSTGQPKGVQVPHRAAVNFLSSMSRDPGLGPDDVLLAVTTLSFDIAVLELLLPLTVGARIVLATQEMVQDGAALAAAIEKHGVTAMQATPSTWRLLIDAGWQGQPAFKIICGGEALPKELALELVERTEHCWNMYGPTETTVWSTAYRLGRGFERVLIGTPIANTQIYVVDGLMNLTPIGVPGELYIGGEGITHGYLNRPELTAERFVADPFGKGGRHLYKTGDLVRLDDGGQLEFIGRNDGQVKVRGFRIELGEIEVNLTRHPAVKQAVVVVREDRPGDVRLVAYLVAAQPTECTDDILRQHLQQSLPAYMVPQHFVMLESFPLTPNRKIDRQRLPEPRAVGQSSGASYVAPRNDIEAMVAGIWQDVLGIGRVSVEDNFFNLGGHSLLAAQMLSRLSRDHQISLGLRTIFEAPTISEFAQKIKNAQQTSSGVPTRIVKRSEHGPAPLSLMQERLWFLEQMTPDMSVNNLPSAFRLFGRFDVEAFERSVVDVLVDTRRCALPCVGMVKRRRSL
ncbi:MAG: amino acid adenylation domain-containing protein [Myxococcota bacterium]